MSKLFSSIPTSLISRIILFCSVFIYVFYSIPQNLLDDHGIMIVGALQVSEGLIPGVDFTYPLGIFSPILLGILIKFCSFFGIGWQYSYFLISTLLFLSLIFTFNYLLTRLYYLKKSHSLIASTLITSAMLYPWGGFYFDYVSLLISLISIVILYKSLLNLNLYHKDKSSKYNSTAFTGLGLVSFLNPFLIKSTSIYLYILFAIFITFYALVSPYDIKLKLKFARDYLLGILVLPIIFIVTNLFDLTKLLEIINYSYAPVFYAEDLGQYSLLSAPKALFDFIRLSSIISLLCAFSLPVISYHEKFDINNYKLISRLFLIFFLYQYIVTWSKDQNWLFLLVSILLLSISLMIRKNDNNRKYKLVSIIFVFLSILNGLYYIIYAVYSKGANTINSSKVLNLGNTHASLFKIKEGFDLQGRLNKDILETSRELKYLFKKGEIKSYAYLDDNAFLVPLLTGIAPIQPFTFYQINKTIFINKKPIDPFKYNLGFPDAFILCKLAVIEENYPISYKNKIDDSLVSNKTNIKKGTSLIKSRFLREYKNYKDFSDAKRIYHDLSKMYVDNYYQYHSNNSCVLYTRNLLN